MLLQSDSCFWLRQCHHNQLKIPTNLTRHWIRTEIFSHQKEAQAVIRSLLSRIKKKKRGLHFCRADAATLWLRMCSVACEGPYTFWAPPGNTWEYTLQQHPCWAPHPAYTSLLLLPATTPPLHQLLPKAEIHRRAHCGLLLSRKTPHPCHAPRLLRCRWRGRVNCTHRSTQLHLSTS